MSILYVEPPLVWALLEHLLTGRRNSRIIGGKPCPIVSSNLSSHQPAAVCPHGPNRVILAPCSTRNLTVARFPSAAASCSSVYPWTERWSILKFGVALISKAAISKLDCLTAMPNALWPTLSVCEMSTFEWAKSHSTIDNELHHAAQWSGVIFSYSLFWDNKHLNNRSFKRFFPSKWLRLKP